jgi:heme/copper-type cytochrome/quinol oxidase subunit 4
MKIVGFGTTPVLTLLPFYVLLDKTLPVEK